MQKITFNFLKKKNACKEGIKYFKEKNLEDIDAIELITKLNADNKLEWSNWLLSQLLTHDNCIRYAIYAAELVLHIFEDSYLADKRPRQAIEAAKKYLKNPTEENKTAAEEAARAAWAAAWAAARAAEAAAWAARAAARAAWAAAWAAARAAEDAAWAAARAAARAAEDAAWAAARAARDAAYNEILQKIIDYGIELLKQQGD